MKRYSAVWVPLLCVTMTVASDLEEQGWKEAFAGNVQGALQNFSTAVEKGSWTAATLLERNYGTEPLFTQSLDQEKAKMYATKAAEIALSDIHKYVWAQKQDLKELEETCTALKFAQQHGWYAAMLGFLSAHYRPLSQAPEPTRGLRLYVEKLGRAEISYLKETGLPLLSQAVHDAPSPEVVEKMIEQLSYSDLLERGVREVPVSAVEPLLDELHAHDMKRGNTTPLATFYGALAREVDYAFEQPSYRPTAVGWAGYLSITPRAKECPQVGECMGDLIKRWVCPRTNSGYVDKESLRLLSLFPPEHARYFDEDARCLPGIVDALCRYPEMDILFKDTLFQQERLVKHLFSHAYKEEHARALFIFFKHATKDQYQRYETLLLEALPELFKTLVIPDVFEAVYARLSFQGQRSFLTQCAIYLAGRLDSEWVDLLIQPSIASKLSTDDCLYWYTALEEQYRGMSYTKGLYHVWVDVVNSGLSEDLWRTSMARYFQQSRREDLSFDETLNTYLAAWRKSSSTLFATALKAAYETGLVTYIDRNLIASYIEEVLFDDNRSFKERAEWMSLVYLYMVPFNDVVSKKIVNLQESDYRDYLFSLARLSTTLPVSMFYEYLNTAQRLAQRYEVHLPHVLAREVRNFFQEQPVPFNAPSLGSALCKLKQLEKTVCDEKYVYGITREYKGKIEYCLWVINGLTGEPLWCHNVPSHDIHFVPGKKRLYIVHDQHLYIFNKEDGTEGVGIPFPTECEIKNIFSDDNEGVHLIGTHHLILSYDVGTNTWVTAACSTGGRWRQLGNILTRSPYNDRDSLHVYTLSSKGVEPTGTLSVVVGSKENTYQQYLFLVRPSVQAHMGGDRDTEDMFLSCWDMQKKEEKWSYRLETPLSKKPLISSDGKQIYLLDTEGTLSALDLSGKAPVLIWSTTVKRKPYDPLNICLSRDETKVYYLANQTFMTLDAKTGDVQATEMLKGNYSLVGLAPDGRVYIQ